MSRSTDCRNGVLVLGLLAALLAPPAPSAADDIPPAVVVSEVDWAGSHASTADEWVELANLTDADIDLSGWSLWTVAGEPKQLAAVGSGTIPAHGFFLLANNGPDYAFSGGVSTLAVQPDVVASSISLSNSALGLELRTATGAVADRVGNGSAPAAGSADPVASMERILSPLGPGSLPGSWRSAAAHTGLDGDGTQQGSPAASGRMAPAPAPVSDPPQPAAPPADTSAPSASIQAVIESHLTGSVRVQATVSVPEESYKTGALILADGRFSIELSLPEGGIAVAQGDVVEVTAKVSRAATPRLLLAKADDVVVLARHQPYAPLPFGADDHPQLYQLLRVSGTVHPAKGVTELRTGPAVFRLTRRQGVALPQFTDGDTATVTGLVVSLDPLDLRVLDGGAVQVASRADPDASPRAGPQSAADEAPTGEGQAAAHVDVVAEEAQDGTAAAAAGDDGEADTRAAPSPSVLGARTVRDWDPLARASLITLVLSLAGMAALAGDAVWIHLRLKQQP